MLVSLLAVCLNSIPPPPAEPDLTPDAWSPSGDPLVGKANRKAVGYGVTGAVVGVAGLAMTGPVHTVPGEDDAAWARAKYPLNFASGWFLGGAGLGWVSAGFAETMNGIGRSLRPVAVDKRYETYGRHLKRSLITWSVVAGVTGSTAAGLLGAGGARSATDTYSLETDVRDQKLYTASMFVFGIAASATTTALAYGVASLMHKRVGESSRACWPGCVAWTPVRPTEVRF